MVAAISSIFVFVNFYEIGLHKIKREEGATGKMKI